ncbi:MAG: uroporphyrinogen-III synthase [Methanimicrococcus sp.]|nr:uroporphyrinogen-III synthase [Methanimicrococcus sp.]MDY0266736.1 uroporphyrinogen-III synthase [Methanimicrococcus sp.]
MEKKPVLAIMRPETYTDASESVAESAGFRPFSVPVVTLKGMKDDVFDGFVNRVFSQKTDFVIFTSANGVDYTLKNLDGVSETDFLNALKKIKIVAIGPTTRSKLESYGLQSSMMPGEYSSDGLVNDLGKEVFEKVVDIPRSFYGTEVLVKGLQDAGATVYQTHVYTLDIPKNALQEELIEKTLSGEIDAFAFTSTMMVKNFMALAENEGRFKEVVTRLNSAIVGAIGHPTAQTVESFGVVVDAVPDDFTFEALVEEIRKKI